MGLRAWLVIVRGSLTAIIEPQWRRLCACRNAGCSFGETQPDSGMDQVYR